ncbi:MAG: c-type cytochrome [Chloroflexi bacterium]|nr:c-type cytochrome [Chloroflexota bacterium]
MNGERQAARWPVLVAVGLLILITLIFLIEFILTTQAELAARQQAPGELTENTYLDRVAALLANANPGNGAKLVEKYNCIACHRAGAENRIAPPFAGVAERAPSRRPPLAAEAYLYEAITHPTAYVVEGFTPAMPQNYPDVLSEQELGDIIAYLLTPGAH